MVLKRLFLEITVSSHRLNIINNIMINKHITIEYDNDRYTI